MNLDPALIKLLQCPKTGEELQLKDNQLVSVNANEHYPLMMGGTCNINRNKITIRRPIRPRRIIKEEG